ncbi:MAG TPA: hypothetical protein PK543_02545, partial [Candidatus Saccharibacteria bacterium]|nr:hypothetical protein [Candidatus Saccharibacteria bacterium]
KDPDELIKQDPKLWQKAIDHPKPAVDWVIEQYSLREDLKTAAGKRKFTTAALDMIRALSDSVEREHYLAQVAEYSDSSIDALKSKLASGGDNKDEKSFKKIVQPTEVAQDPALYQDNLLAVALIDSATHDLFSQIDITMFSGEERQAVAKYVKTLGAKTIKDTPKDLQNYDTYVKILLLKADARYADWNDHDRYFETARLLRLITTEHKKKQKDLLIEELRDAETLGDDTKAAQIRTALNNLIKEIQSGQS